MLRNTHQRDALTTALAQAGRPLSPQEWLDEARRQIPGLGQATVYRAIKSMVKEGLAVEVKVPGEPDRYEAAGKAHHHHFLCKTCDRLYEIEGCPGNLHALAPNGYTVESHELTLYGRCPACKKPAPAKRRKTLNAAAALLFVLGFLLAPLLHQLETAHSHHLQPVEALTQIHRLHRQHHLQVLTPMKQAWLLLFVGAHYASALPAWVGGRRRDTYIRTVARPDRAVAELLARRGLDRPSRNRVLGQDVVPKTTP